jgi:hypothetical protein
MAALLGLPLAVVRSGGGGDNQMITYLMIDPVSGFAPAQWQSEVGPCTVVRWDGGDYTAEDHSYLHDYLSMLLDMWGDGTPTAYLNPRSFQSFVRRRISEELYDDEAQFWPKLCRTALAPLVRLRGLSSDSLNGSKGFRGAWLEARGRFQVYLKNGRDVSVKPSNMELLSDDALRKCVVKQDLVDSDEETG